MEDKPEEIVQDPLKEARESMIEKISVAGWKEMFDEKIIGIARTFQIAFLILSVCCLYYNYQDIKQFINTDNSYRDEIQDVPNGEQLPFTNVTICAEVFFNGTFVKENIVIPQNVAMRYTNQTGKSLEALYEELTRYLSLTGRPKKFEPALLRYFSQILRNNPNIDNYSAFSARALVPCSSILKKCWFNGQEFDCCERAIQALDSDGICYLLASSVGSSVISSRNYGLLRGVAIRDSFSVLRQYAKHKRSNEKLKNSSDSKPTSDEDEDNGDTKTTMSESSALVKAPVPILERQHTAPANMSAGGVHDKATTTWDWPLGNPMVKNGEDQFEVKLKISPFKADEVSVYITGNELIVHCASSESGGCSFGQIFRAYTLPLNVNPRSAEFTMTRSGYVRISVQKEQPLKMAVACGAEPNEAAFKKIELSG